MFFLKCLEKIFFFRYPAKKNFILQKRFFLNFQSKLIYSNWQRFLYSLLSVALRGVGEDLSALRDRGRTVQDPFSTINIHEGSHWIFRTLHVVGFLLSYRVLLNSCKRRQDNCIKSYELTDVDRLISQVGIKWTLRGSKVNSRTPRKSWFFYLLEWNY